MRAWKVERCFCGATPSMFKSSLELDPYPFYLRCDGCSFEGKTAGSRTGAVDLWNKEVKNYERIFKDDPETKTVH